jgi:hypothetical protein
MRIVRISVSAAALLAGLCLAPADAHAQSAGAPAADLRQQISASPFLVMYQYFNLEYEHRATRASTWGLSTSFFPSSGADYRNVGAFWHFYPGGQALRGFYIGGRVQAHRASDDRVSATLGGVGFELGKNWIIGRRTLVGIGAGVTRLFGTPLGGDTLTLPTFRIANVGVAF